MLRSLFSGVSGLSAHQVKLDVISDNIANVNTYGFKKSRTVFSNIFNQTIGYPSAPTDARGGVNPKQIGLGVQTAAIDRIMTQGAPESTGNASDCAIEGNGFFVVDSGEKNIYTRAGNFIIDESGDLVHGSTGSRVLGWAAKYNEESGNFDLNSGGVLESINFLDLEKLSARSTTEMVFKSNLKSDVESRAFPEENTLTYGIAPNEEDLKLKMQKRNDTLWEFSMTDDDGNLVDLDPTAAGVQTQGLVTLYDDGRIKNVQVNGNFDIYSVSANGTIGITDNFTITLANSTPPVVNYWTFKDINNVDQEVYINFEKDASSTTNVDVYRFKMYDAEGNLLDMDANGTVNDQEDYGTMSIISVTGKIAGFNADPLGVTGNPTSILWNGMTLDLSISPDTRQLSFTEQSSGQKRDIELGSNSVQFRVNGTNKTMNFDFIPGTSHTTSLNVFDSQGTPHELITSFEKLDENKWRYSTSLSMDDPIVRDYIKKFPDSVLGNEATAAEKKAIMKNIFWDAENGFTGEGFLKFNELGRIDTEGTRQANNVSYPKTIQTISFSAPGTMQLNIDYDVAGITQYDSEEFTTAARSQNGYEMGILQGYTIQMDGQIVGSYTNDRAQTIGQLAVATFQNPQGLEKLTGSMWTSSGNSGEAVIRKAGSGGAGIINSGKLEMSNVDLSQEFTDMIIAQRGFQANSKSITTADQILQELINLKR
ncbi:MAG: flagellar hook-basal body complex protein [Candidatus Muirbacterium halophilum]|nr:flagellar hook-basal body complex protein [Candidatus Muirbacterium halophilum]MCK9477153.1 flagellar hook-basal body complex protein [Candidatus Muirbacterium halophilum]